MFRLILFPYLRPTLVVAVLFRLIDSIKAFLLIYVLTNGGPGTATEVTNYYALPQWRSNDPRPRHRMNRVDFT